MARELSGNLDGGSSVVLPKTATRVSELTGHQQMKEVVGDLLRDRPIQEHQTQHPPRTGEHLLAPSKWIPGPRPSFQRTNQDLRNLRVTVPHHFEGIAPTGPICRMPDPLCAQGAQLAQRQWQTGDVPSALWNLRSQQLGQTPPRRPCR